ncbi:MAG: alpha-E domain-containing protein [Prevotella sp.]|jgi:hypothetical protein
MVKSEIISAATANRLYWLGRYEERVYMTLHLLRQCYDLMIDGQPSEYDTFWGKLDSNENYNSKEEFELGMMYDDKNPNSVFSALLRAMDNAILLREMITSDTLSYLEMSVALMRECKARREKNVTALQRVSDWSLAFWGCAEQCMDNKKSLGLMQLGRDIEYMDMLIRFDYPVEKLKAAWQILMQTTGRLDDKDLVDNHVATHLSDFFLKGTWRPNDFIMKNEALKALTTLIRI